MSVSYIDRQTLAAIAPSVQKALSIPDRAYGDLVSAFSIAYLVGAPAAGYLIDRIGARRAEQFEPLCERGQAEGRDVGLEKAHRMRVEGRDDRGAALVLGMAHRAADDRLIDADGNGLADRVLAGPVAYADTDGDGRWDVQLTDTDGDGAADAVGGIAASAERTNS